MSYKNYLVHTMDTGTVPQQPVARQVDAPRISPLLPRVTVHDWLSPSRSADPSPSRTFPFGRKINRGGGRCNGELTSVDSEQKDKTHPMNNGSPVAHYTGEGSRAVLYVKTWTVGWPVGASLAVQSAPQKLLKFREGRDTGISVVLGPSCQARKYLPIRSMLIRIQMCLRFVCRRLVYMRDAKQKSRFYSAG